jgi:hypothetical protein
MDYGIMSKRGTRDWSDRRQPDDSRPEESESPGRSAGAEYIRKMSFDEVNRVIETAVVSDSVEVLSQLRVNLTLMWPTDADAELLARIITRRLERLRQASSGSSATSDVVVINPPSREPSMVRPMGVPDSLDGVTTRATPWSAERITAPDRPSWDAPVRNVWRIIVAGVTLPLLGEPDDGFPRGTERAAILRHIAQHRPQD